MIRMSTTFFHRGGGWVGRRPGRPRVVSAGRTPVWVAAALAVVLLVVAGIVYRVMASSLQSAIRRPIQLPIPLSAVPLEDNGWSGQDSPISTLTKEYMESHFADDYIHRRYTHAAQGLGVDIFVVYCSSRPRGILGHKPRVCYPGNGWIWDRTDRTQIVSRSGRRIDCLMHEFHKPVPAYQHVYVLNFYVLNGQITLRESDFSGFLDRLPNLAGNPARYVAQIQISSMMEQAARVAAADFVDTILALLPDEQGRVPADPNGPRPVAG
jgi:hypothetical protein